MSNIRYEARQVLIADALGTGIAALLPGGIYPTASTGEGDVTALTREIKDAFDPAGDVLPCAMITDEGSVGFGPYPTSQMGFLRVWLFQQYGRDVIEDAQVKVVALLSGKRLQVGGRYRTLRFAGFGPSGITDRALRDAPVGWVRFQAMGLVTLP